MHILNFDRYRQIALHRGCTSLHSLHSVFVPTPSFTLDTFNLCLKIGKYYYHIVLI